jgi:hypothetical protein
VGTATKKTKTTDQLQQADAQRRSAGAWRAKMNEGHEVECPSGNVALLRRPGPEMFLRSGGIPDGLTPIVEASIRDKQGLPPEKVAALATDKKLLPAMGDMIDSAVVAACIEPVVRPNPTCVRPNATDANEVCDEPAGAEIHQPDSRDYHEFIAGDAEPPEDRDPDFLYAAEIDYMDKVFIFQYAVGGSADLERFRQQFSELVASVDSVDINRS